MDKRQVNLYLSFACSFLFFNFVATCTACRSSQTRDWIRVAAMTSAAAGAMLDSWTHSPGEELNPHLHRDVSLYSQIFNSLQHSRNSSAWVLMLKVPWLLAKKHVKFKIWNDHLIPNIWVESRLRQLCLRRILQFSPHMCKEGNDRIIT